MFIGQPLPFVSELVEALQAALQAHQPGSVGLSRCQRWWVGRCLRGSMVTNTVCWARFERASLGQSSRAALAWLFRHAKIPWERLLQCRTTFQPLSALLPNRLRLLPPPLPPTPFPALPPGRL